MEWELLQYIEMSGGVSPKWLPKNAVEIPSSFLSVTKPAEGLFSKKEKIVLFSIGVVLLVALGIMFYLYNRKKDKLFEEKVRKFKEEKLQTELEPEENGRK